MRSVLSTHDTWLRLGSSRSAVETQERPSHLVTVWRVPTVTSAKKDFQIRITKFGRYPHFQGMRAVNKALTAEGRSAVWVRSKTCFKVFLFINQGETFI